MLTFAIIYGEDGFWAIEIKNTVKYGLLICEALLLSSKTIPNVKLSFYIEIMKNY